jgi:hypothetical protein
MRQRILARAAVEAAGGTLVRHGMRSWMEAAGQRERAARTLAPPAGRPRRNAGFPAIAMVLAGMVVGRAERSNDGPRQA